MERYNTSEAYDFSRFEPKRKEAAPAPQRDNIITLPQKELEKNRRPRIGLMRILSVFFTMVVIVGAVSSLVYGQVRLTELTEGVNAAAKSLEESESVYTQLQMKSDSLLCAGAVETYAQDKLGMKKAEQGQVEYVTLSDGDKGQVLQECGVQGFFGKIWSAVCQLLS